MASTVHEKKRRLRVLGLRRQPRKGGLPLSPFVGTTEAVGAPLLSSTPSPPVSSFQRRHQEFGAWVFLRRRLHDQERVFFSPRRKQGRGKLPSSPRYRHRDLRQDSPLIGPLAPHPQPTPIADRAQQHLRRQPPRVASPPPATSTRTAAPPPATSARCQPPTDSLHAPPAAPPPVASMGRNHHLPAVPVPTLPRFRFVSL
ncbi:arginine-glutamic acid dipeptide repeats protein-like isoform X2 [Zingiber officinale]|nr:arginine-glutamic acid dipeptide repeats protein-like isoform X2 [Zingiber officinale]